mmetsp:Transcript_13504/g.23179  ORF Transcript_13504/g.23179 Transcript_13504/m.23179 type:complete len:97 (-) Transcript_13504:23-313(-)
MQLMVESGEWRDVLLCILFAVRFASLVATMRSGGSDRCVLRLTELPRHHPPLSPFTRPISTQVWRGPSNESSHMVDCRARIMGSALDVLLCFCAFS